jgi:hypothetical protein
MSSIDPINPDVTAAHSASNKPTSKPTNKNKSETHRKTQSQAPGTSKGSKVDSEVQGTARSSDLSPNSKTDQIKATNKNIVSRFVKWVKSNLTGKSVEERKILKESLHTLSQIAKHLEKKTSPHKGEDENKVIFGVVKDVETQITLCDNLIKKRLFTKELKNIKSELENVHKKLTESGRVSSIKSQLKPVHAELMEHSRKKQEISHKDKTSSSRTFEQKADDYFNVQSEKQAAAKKPPSDSANTSFIDALGVNKIKSNHPLIGTLEESAQSMWYAAVKQVSDIHPNFVGSRLTSEAYKIFANQIKEILKQNDIELKDLLGNEDISKKFKKIHALNLLIQNEKDNI